MKKMFFCLMMAMIILSTVSVFAGSRTDKFEEHNHVTVSSQGARCRGTLGCGCYGFSPITNGAVWQQAYCRYCGHHRTYHR